MNTHFQKEDPTTERLADLLNAHRSVCNAFVSIRDGKLKWAIDNPTLSIQTQVSIPGGRIDMLLSDGPRAIIIECKVKDRQKVYQLEKYHEYWSSMHGIEPQLFWLTRRQDDVLWGAYKYLAGQLTWNNLHDGLKQRLGSFEPIAVRSDVEEFLIFLKDAGILLDRGVETTIHRREKGLSRERAFRMLQSIADHFTDSAYKIDEENELPYRLLIGRKRWVKEFNDQLVKKVRIFLQPDANTEAGFFIWPRICLYHWQEYLGRRTNEETKQAYFRERFLQWTNHCSKAGLVIVRNAPGKIRRGHNCEMPPPFTFDPSIQVLLAEEPESTARAKSALCRDDADFIQVGIEEISRLMHLIDELRR